MDGRWDAADEVPQRSVGLLGHGAETNGWNSEPLGWREAGVLRTRHERRK